MPKDGGGHAGHHPSPWLDSLPPPVILVILSDHHYMFHFSMLPPFFFFTPFNHLSDLFGLPPCTYSLSPTRAPLPSPSPLLSPPTGRLLCYLITLTRQDVGRARPPLFLCLRARTCASVEGQVQGLGAHPTRYPNGTQQQREGRRVQQGKYTK